MSRFLRFFRVFVVAVICGFGALSANALVTLNDGGAIYAGAPHSIERLNSNTRLAAFPYRPGYGFAGYYTAQDCASNAQQILTHEGTWTGTQYDGTIYACWVPLVASGSTNIKLFVLNKNGGDTVGNMWPNLDQPIEFNTDDLGYGGTGRSIRFENRGDWVYLRCYDYNNLTGVCNGDVKWYMPRNAGGGQVFVSVDKFFWSIEGVQELPTRSGYVFGGMYSIRGTGGTQYCNASGNTINMAYHLSTFDDLPAFNTIYARWNRLKVNLSGNGVSPSTVYLQYGDNWYSSLDGSTPITALNTEPTNGNNVFGGYYTAPQCQGTPVVNANKTFRTDNAALTAITEDNTTIYPCWTAQATWVTLTINNQNGLGTPWKLYYPLSGCSIQGYHTSQDCLNTNVVASLADWYGVPTRDGWVYGGHWTGTDGTNLDGSQNPYIGTDGALQRTITNSTTVYAKWTFGVSYVAGTGTGSQTTGPTVCTYSPNGMSCLAPTPTFTPPSNEPQFAGWECTLRVDDQTTNTPCAQQVYYTGDNLAGATQGSEVSGSITGITLKAKWGSTSTITYHKLTLNPNGGSNGGSGSFGGSPFIHEGEGVGFFKCTGSGRDEPCAVNTEITSSIFNSVANGGAGIARPTRAGYEFKGYWTTLDNSGELIIDEDGIIQVGPGYFTSARTLYAHWLETQTVQTVPLDLGEHGSWGTCGVTSIQVVPGGAPLESQLSCVPTANTGWNFIGYYDSDSNNATQYYDANGYAVYPDNVWPISNAPTELVARYEPITHMVKYYCGGNSPVHTDNVQNGDQYTVWNGAGVEACANTAATSGNNGEGSKLVGWDTQNSGNVVYLVGENFDSFTITGDMDLSMVQKPIYYVTLNHCNDSLCSSYPISNSPNPSTVYFSNGNWYSDASAITPRNTMNPKPDRFGYIFGGYNTESNGSGTTVVNNSGTFVTGGNYITANSSTIYAQWTVLQRQITLDLDGGDGGPAVLWHQIDKWSLNQDGGAIFRITAPTKSNNSFAGYWIKDGDEFVRKIIDSNGDILFFGQEAAELIGSMREPRKFYARWDDMPSAPTNPNEYFAVTTMAMSAGQSFTFGMSAEGTFYVDWGDGTIDVIDRSGYDQAPQRYSHTYTTASGNNGWTIKIWGEATGYKTWTLATQGSAISFGQFNGTGIVNPDVPMTPERVAGISGSLGAVFPTINGGGDASKVPGFFATFYGCTNLTGTIPYNLFSGITGNRSNMFRDMFSNTGVTGISGTSAQQSQLFSGISGVAEGMFNHTFSYTNITSIPAGLFSTISATGNATGSADYMFDGTFASTGITTLPATLFGEITASGVSKSGMMDNMFVDTPLNEPGQNYIPKTLFLNSNNQPIISDTNSNNSLMSGIFDSTGLVTDCADVNLTNYPTPTAYESYWSGKKICAPAAVFSCGIGTGTAPNPIFVTPVDSGSVSFTFPSGANCTAPAHYTKNNTWTCDGNVCNNGSITWGSNGQTPFNGTWNGQQSVTFYMTYTPNEYTIVLNQNHSSNDNTTVSGSPIKERYGDTWLDSNGVILNPQKAPVPSSWTSNNTTYNFKGYFTSRSGGTRMTTNDGTFVNDAATHTVGSDGTWYAQWDDSNNVTFKCEEGGSAINGYSFTNVQNGDSINVPATSVCTKTGYTFTQWKIVANGVLIDETNNGGIYAWNYNFGSDVVPDWQRIETTITLDKHGGTDGTSALYTRWGVGVYRDSDRTQEMKTGENPLTAPNKSVTLTLSLGNSNASIFVNNQVYTGSAGVQRNLTFKGYYSSASSTTKYIESTGYITPGPNGGMQTGAGYTSDDNTWHAQWEPVAVVSTGNMPVPTWAGHVFNGWWTTADDSGTQITEDDGSFLDADDKYLSASTTWYAHWTGCSHDFGSNPHASKTAITAVDGMCGYHITCDTDPGVPLGAGYSQYGENDTTGAFDFYVLPSSTGTLPGCSPRVYNIQYYLMGVSATLPQSGTPQTYTYGVGGTSITGVPSSEGSVFLAWCTDAGLSSCVSSSPYYTIGATDYGDKIYYAKWDSQCQPGYTKYDYYTLSYEFGVGGVQHPAGTCAPIRYRVDCHNNCPAGECKACLEDFTWPGHSLGDVQFGGVYNSYGMTSAENNWIYGYEPVYEGTCTGNGCLFMFTQSPDAGYLTAPVSFSTDALYVAYVNNNYRTFIDALAANNGSSSIGREHYTFDGLWTAADGGNVYIPANGSVAWTGQSSEAQDFSQFFANQLGGGDGTNNNYVVDVYAHWIPDEYTITLNANGGVVGNVTVLKEKWNTGWSKDNGASYQTAANFVALTVAERPVRTGHTFAGYYTERQTQVGQSCPGTKIVNSNGSLNTGASSSTGTVGNAKYFGANGSTLYACWTPVQKTITLDNANATINGTASLTSKYGVGAYLNGTLMESDGPAITLPQHNGYTVSFNMYAGAPGQPDDQTVSWLFKGYFNSATGSTKYIDSDGKITASGTNKAKTLTSNTTWKTQWTERSTIELPSVYNPAVGYFGKPNHLFNGWWTAANGGTKAGNSGDAYTPSANITLHAHWNECSYTGGNNATVEHYGENGVYDNNVCVYKVTCDTNYSLTCPPEYGNSCYYSNGYYIVEGAPDNPVVAIPDCTGSDVTITYYDNPAYGATDPLNTQGYTYSSNGTVTLWTPDSDSDVWAAHHASSVQWCTNLNDDTTCVNAGGTIPANGGNVTFYAKWTCATGYRTYTYDTWNAEWGASEAMHYNAGMCAPIRYRVICYNNCPVGETCNACLEDFNMPDNQGSGYNWGNAYNSRGINQTDSGWISLAVPVKSTNTTPEYSTLFTLNPNYEAIFDWPNGLESDADLYNAYVTDKNYKTFMEGLASKSYNSNINFGAVHYDFDGLWTAANGGEQYISADGLSPTGGGAFDTQEMSTFFTSDTNVYAHWTPKKYQVVLDKNASDAVAGTVGEIWEKWNDGWALTQNGTYNSTRTLSGGQLPTRTGYTFAGYFDTNAGTGGSAMGSVSNGVWTTPGATATDVNPTTWYARWTPNQYTVTYDCGDGTGAGSTDNTPRYGQSYTPKTYATAGCGRPSNGYYFNGWDADISGTPGIDIKPAGVAFNWNYMENKTFTARWVAKEYHITFDKNGGSGGTNEVWEHYGASGGFWHDAGQNTITEITLPTNPGHTFAGYALTINGAPYITGTTLPAPTLDFGDTSNNSTVNITLVARWSASAYNVRYNLGGGTTTLPVGYVPVEYITFSGTQVIDTGLKIKKGYEIQTKFYPTDTGKYVYGALSSGNSKTVSGYVSTAGGNWRWGNKAISKTMSLNSTYTIVQNASALTVNGVPDAYETQDNFETGVTLSIGKAHSASGGTNYDTSGFKGRMYWFTIRDDNGNVVYHGVPVKNTANNQYGLCNIIDGTCLTASGINGATATLPASYTYGTATTVSGSAARANSVFNSWCSSPSSNCNSTQTIPATATGDKTFYAKWTCDAGYSYSSGGACVANTITLDWNENGGVGLTNGSCTYNGDLTLGVAPTYADHVFNGWKLANNTYGGASTTVNGGCVQAYTGVTSGTSTAITAQWCNACNPTNATCELNATAQPGTCTYTTSCNTGYHLSPDSQLNVYNTVCIPYTITYQSDGHGDGATDDVLYNGTFTTNNAKNSSQFNWDNHIVTAWTTVSGGNFPNLGAEYPYNVQSDTVLKANWGECHCTPGTGATSCSTTSSNNECEVNIIMCNTGFTGSTWSCDGINCTATCNNDNRHTITLNNNNGTGGTTTLYTIYGTGSDAGVYIDSDRTNRMTPNPNGTYPITAPTLSRTVSYDITSNGTVTGAAFAQQPTSVNTSAVATFNGYYISTTETEQYIEDDGYINATGVSKGKGYTTNKTWYAQWTYGFVTLPIAYRPGYTLSGWSTTVGGTSVGNAGDSYTTSSNVTLYPVWEKCAAGTYCPGVETVNNQTVYNQIHNCPTKYSNSAAGSKMISDCYLVLTAGKWVETAGAGMVPCTQNYYCNDNITKVYYSDETNDGRRTTGIRKSCATNAGSFSLTDAPGKTSINACYKNVTLNKRGGSGTLGGASGTDDGSKKCRYNQNCELPDASVLQLTGHTFHGGWSQTDEDCDSTTRVFVVPDEVDTYYACRTTNSYEVTLADGLNTNTVLGTIRPTYGAAMPSVDSNGNPLTVPTKNASHTTYTFEGYYEAQQNGTTATQYYDYNLNSTHVWDKTGNEDVLYARWSVTCDPGYYLPENATSCTTLCPAGRYCAGNTTFTSFDVPKSSSQGLSGYIAAGYYSTGGGTSATPTAAGNGCVSGNSCGLVAGGYYSTGGGTSATPTAAGNGCVSGNNRSCGVLGANYYSNGGGTNNAGACVTGQTCGACPTKYRSNSDTGKTVITRCTAACGAGTQVATAETTTNNGCETPLGNTWWSNAHTVAYGSASPIVSDPNATGRHSCLSQYNTPQTTNATDHDDRSDCTRAVPLYKNGGATVDGAVWPSNVTDNGGTAIASATCAEGETCNFGNPANLLEQTGYTFLANWGTNASCSSTVGTSVTTPTATRYYACRVKNNYTLTYACGTGTTGTAPNQQTNIHYGDTVSVSGAGGCAKTGHTFAGWAVSGTSDVITATTWPHDITWDYDGSKTFTAQWTANTYSISYVGNGGTAGSILPDGYTQLEYIESNGNQYIVTNFIPSSDFKHTIVFEGLSGNSNSYIAGTVASAAGRAGNVRINGSYINGVYGNNTSNGAGMLIDTTKTGGMSVLNGKSVLVLDLHNNAANSITLNGVQVANTDTARITSTAPMNLFALASNYRSKIRLYSDTIEQNGVLVHNYVPAQNSDGVVGLYDTVTGVFFTNRGNGSFTPGNPVTAAYPNQYTYGVGATVTGGAVRANSVFQGWCRTASLTNCAAPHEITTTDMGDITLYAKWGCVTGYHNVNNQCVVNEFTLVYNKNGHGTQNTPINQTCRYGQQINLADDLSETGWWFNGWNIADETYIGDETIVCNEEYLGVTGGATMTTVNVTADWSARCNKITLATNSNAATWPSGSITALYAKTRESGSTTDGKWYKDNGCTIEYTSADYAKVIPTRSGWAFRGFYANQSNAADINATQANGVEQHIDHTGAPTGTTGQNFINELNANTVLYAGWARDCMNPVAHGTCSRTIGQNTTYTTTCATGYHYDPTASESTYNPICVPNTITIILNKNGGDGTCGGQSGTTSGTLTCNYDGTCNTPVWSNTCALSKTGKIFAGWNTAANGTGTQYGTATVAGDVQNINNGTTSTTLYAVWENAVCNVTNGSAAVSVSGNTVACDVTCNNGYESNGIYAGQQHEWVVDTGQCNASVYNINYELNGGNRVVLPAEYTRLAYIQSDGNEILETNYAVQENDVLELHYKLMPGHLVKSGDKMILRAANLWAETYGAYNQWYTRFGSSSSVNTEFASNQSEGVLVLKKNALIVNGNQILSPAFNATLNGASLRIFGSIDSGGNPASTAIIQSSGFNIMRDGQMIMNLVPARQNSSGVVGMYDTVSNTFLTKTGSGSFVAGPEIHETVPEGYMLLDYIQSSGNSYIDLGFKANSAMRIETEFQRDTTGEVSPFGVYGFGGNIAFYTNTTSANSYFYGSSKIDFGVKLNTTDWHTAVVDGSEGFVSVDGVSKAYSPTAFTQTQNMILFGRHNSSGYGMFMTGRVRYFRVYNGGTLYFNGIPARNSEGLVGIYDTISGDFFVGDNSAGFSAGPSIDGAYPDHYTYGIGAKVYGGATRANSVFEGWCRNAALTDGCTMIPHVIDATEYGDKDLYAKWSCVNGYHLDGNNQCVGNTITIKYQNGGHGGTPNPSQHTCVYGATRNLAGAMGEVGYAFVGWGINNEVYDASENITCDYNTLGVYGGTIDNGTVVAEAQWDTVEYVVTYDCNTTWSNPALEPQYIRTGGTFRTRQNTCQNPGYRFVKWAVSGTSPQEYKNENEQFTWGYTENKTFSAVWEFEPTFTVTTKDIEPGTAFSFKIAAKGQFVVDWGDGNIEPFTNTSANQITKSHTFESAAFGGQATKSFVIRFGGRATGYNTSYSVPAIQFFTGSISNEVITSGTEIHIARIDGSLGSIFPTLGDTYSTQPRFFRTFQNAINMSQTMQSLAGLFTGISGTPMPYMFYGTFRNCPGLTGDIPANMFPINGAPATALFRETFMDCTGLTGTIPQTLFAGIQGAPKNYMFYSTFRGCTNLTGIPAGLFAGINGTPATAMFGRTFMGCAEITGTLSSNLFGTLTGAPASEMFSRTFEGCAKLRGDTSSDTVAIPAGMFGNLTGNPASYMFYLTFYGCGELTGTIGGPLFYGTGAPASYMFSGTFQDCKKLSGSIPNGLFGAISGDAAEYMYNSTFYGCENLTGSIPNRLFGSITGVPKNNMFSGTFYNCKNLTGEIPSGLFGNINGDAAQYMFNLTFYNCEKLTGTIPSGLFGNITGTPKNRMFRLTFYSADRLTGYVPEGLFGSLSATPEANEMMDRIFAGTGLLTTCPCGTTEVDSDFRIPYWQSSTSTNPSSTTYKISCRVGLKPGEHWYGNQCTTACSDTAIDELHVGNLNPYVVLADPVSTVKNLAVKHNNTVCYVPVASGNGGTNSLNMKYGNTVYHADRPNDTPPAGFGQR